MDDAVCLRETGGSAGRGEREGGRDEEKLPVRPVWTLFGLVVLRSRHVNSLQVENKHQVSDSEMSFQDEIKNVN